MTVAPLMKKHTLKRHMQASNSEIHRHEVSWMFVHVRSHSSPFTAFAPPYSAISTWLNTVVQKPFISIHCFCTTVFSHVLIAAVCEKLFICLTQVTCNRNTLPCTLTKSIVCIVSECIIKSKKDISKVVNYS